MIDFIPGNKYQFFFSNNSGEIISTYVTVLEVKADSLTFVTRKGKRMVTKHVSIFTPEPPREPYRKAYLWLSKATVYPGHRVVDDYQHSPLIIATAIYD